MAKKVTFNKKILVEEINATSETELEKIIARVTSLVIKELKSKKNVKPILKKTSKDSNSIKTSSTEPKHASLTPKKKKENDTSTKEKSITKKKKSSSSST